MAQISQHEQTLPLLSLVIPLATGLASSTGRMVKRAAWGLVCTVFACSHALAADPMQTRAVWLASCPSDPTTVVTAEGNRSAAIGLVVAAMAPKLIDGAVDMAAEALKAAGQTKTFTSTAKSADYFYQISQSADLKVAANCLVIVRGTFDEKKASQHKLAAESDQFKGLQKANLHFEAKLKPLRGLKYFQLVPQYLEVVDFDQFRLFGSKKRDYIVAISLTVPGGAQPFGSAEMTFKNITRKTILEGDDWRLKAASSLPISFPAESTDATKAKEKREGQVAPYLLALDILSTPEKKPFDQAPGLYEDKKVLGEIKKFCSAIKLQNASLSEDNQLYDERCNYPLISVRRDLDNALEIANRNSQRVKWANSVCTYVKEDAAKKAAAYCSNQKPDPNLSQANFTYFTTQLTLSETSEGSKFALYLGNALSSSKAEVSAALQEKYLPKSKEVREKEEAEALFADMEVTKAEESLAAALLQDPPVPVDITAARIALVKAKYAANEAYRKRGKSIPFRNLSGV